MNIAVHSAHESFGSITDRLEACARCPKDSFNPEDVLNLIEEAIGGSSAGVIHKAPIAHFSRNDLALFKRVIDLFDQKIEAKDKGDLVLYEELIVDAHNCIVARETQLAKQEQYSPEQRIDLEAKKTRRNEIRLFNQAHPNTFNATGALYTQSKKPRLVA